MYVSMWVSFVGSQGLGSLELKLQVFVEPPPRAQVYSGPQDDSANALNSRSPALCSYLNYSTNRNNFRGNKRPKCLFWGEF